MLDAFKKRRSNAHNEEGRSLLDDGRLDEAQEAFERSIDLDPSFPAPWFNLGLVHKQRRSWRETIRCNRKVVELTGGTTDDPAWWNMGIAATAVRDWETARQAWRSYGVPIPDGTGPVEGSFGMAPIRVSPDAAPEVVWARRLDPARALLLSVPMPESGHRWRDIVLHDGVPNGERMLEGTPRAVFDEIEPWEPSSIPTLEAILFCATIEDSNDVGALFGEMDRAAEDWSQNIQMLCKACSEGRIDPTHDHEIERVWNPERRFGIAATPDDANRLLRSWVSLSPETRAIRQTNVVLDAGQ